MSLKPTSIQDYSQLPEIKQSYYLGGKKLNKKKPLLKPKKNHRYRVYFNLNAIRSGQAYPSLPYTKQEIEDLTEYYSDPKFPQRGEGASSIPTPKERAFTFFNGSIYSFKFASHDWKIMSHQRSGILTDVVLHIDKSKVKNIQAGQPKGPCCFLDGYYKKSITAKQQREWIRKWQSPKARQFLEKQGWKQVVFNPKFADQFMYKDTSDPSANKFGDVPLFSAEEIIFMSAPKPVIAIGFMSLPYFILAKNPNSIQNYTDTQKTIARKKGAVDILPAISKPRKPRKPRATLTPLQRIQKMTPTKVATETAMRLLGDYEDIGIDMAKTKAQRNKPLKKNGLFIVSLYSRSGKMIENWREKTVNGKVINKGNICVTMDIGPKTYANHKGCHHIQADLTTLTPMEVMAKFGKKTIDVLFCFPPCTEWSLVGNSTKLAKVLKDPYVLRKALNLVDVARNYAVFSKFWMIENPAGQLNKAWRRSDWTFEPYQYAGYCPTYEEQFFNYYTKKTSIWANFPKPPIEPMTVPVTQRYVPIDTEKIREGLACPIIDPRAFAGRFLREKGKGKIQYEIAQEDFAKLYLQKTQDKTLKDLETGKSSVGTSVSRKINHYLRSLTPTGFARALYFWLHEIKIPTKDVVLQYTPILAEIATGFKRRQVVLNPNLGPYTKGFLPEWLGTKEAQKMLGEIRNTIHIGDLDWKDPKFQKWFKGSVVKTKRGKPILVYRGTADIRNFVKTGKFRGGQRYVGYDSGGSAYFFTNSLRVAKTYATDKSAFDYGGAIPAVAGFYLRLKNPIIVDGKGQSFRNTENRIKEAYQKGHDGVIIQNSLDSYNVGKIPSTVYVVFDLKNVKLANGRLEPYGEVEDTRKNPRKRKNGRNLGYGSKNGTMLRNQLRTIKRTAKDLHDLVRDDDELPDWVLSKATVAMDRLSVAHDYVKSKLEGMTPNPRVQVNSAIDNGKKTISMIKRI